MLIKYWKEHRKNIDFLDMVLIKFSMVALTLFVITIWSGAMDWVHTVNTWYFLAATAIIGARPFYKYYIQRK